MSVIVNFAKALSVTGPQYGHIAWWLATQPAWEDDNHFDDFIRTLGGRPQVGP